MSHTLQEVIDLAVKTAVLKAHPVGSYWITETDDDPNIIFGGGGYGNVFRASSCNAPMTRIRLGRI